MNMHDKGRRPSTFAMFTCECRCGSCNSIFLRLGFLDGMAGFQVCMHTAFYAFLKQAKLWEMHYAIPQPDPESERAADHGNRAQILSLAEQRTRSAATAGEKKQQHQAA